MLMSIVSRRTRVTFLQCVLDLLLMCHPPQVRLRIRAFHDLVVFCHVKTLALFDDSLDCCCFMFSEIITLFLADKFV